MSPPVIGLGGYMRSGKDTVADILVREHGYTKIAFADALKAEVREHYRRTLLAIADVHDYERHPGTDDLLGWLLREKPYPAVRALLQEHGVMRRKEDPDYWIKALDGYRQVLKAPQVVIPDVRFLNEVQYVRRQGAPFEPDVPICPLWLVVRPGCHDTTGHESERLAGEGREVWDRALFNDGSLDELALKVRGLLGR